MTATATKRVIDCGPCGDVYDDGGPTVEEMADDPSLIETIDDIADTIHHLDGKIIEISGQLAQWVGDVPVKELPELTKEWAIRAKSALRHTLRARRAVSDRECAIIGSDISNQKVVVERVVEKVEIQPKISTEQQVALAIENKRIAAQRQESRLQKFADICKERIPSGIYAQIWGEVEAVIPKKPTE